MSKHDRNETATHVESRNDAASRNDVAARAMMERSAVPRLTRLQIMQLQDLRRQRSIDRGDPGSPLSPSAKVRPCWHYQYNLR